MTHDSVPERYHVPLAHVGMRTAELNAVTISADGSFKGGDILQTTHCLELVLSGRMKVGFNNGTQEIQADDIQFRKRGNYQLEPSADYSAIIFFLDDAFVADFIKETVHFSAETIKEELPPFLFKSSDFIRDNMEHALRKIMNFEIFSPCIVKLTALQVLFQIFSKDNPRTFAGYLRYLITDRKVDLTYFMETNFTQNMSLEEMAKLTGRSVSTFKKEFTALFHTSPQKWLINRRLEHAGFLLAQTNTPVSDIAYQSGFENISHFSKTFRQKFGQTPSEARMVSLS